MNKTVLHMTQLTVILKEQIQQDKVPRPDKELDLNVLERSVVTGLKFI